MLVGALILRDWLVIMSSLSQASFTATFTFNLQQVCSLTSSYLLALSFLGHLPFQRQRHLYQ
jgi:hypothetical protein